MSKKRSTKLTARSRKTRTTEIALNEASRIIVNTKKRVDHVLAQLWAVEHCLGSCVLKASPGHEKQFAAAFTVFRDCIEDMQALSATLSMNGVEEFVRADMLTGKVA